MKKCDVFVFVFFVRHASNNGVCENGNAIKQVIFRKFWCLCIAVRLQLYSSFSMYPQDLSLKENLYKILPVMGTILACTVHVHRSPSQAVFMGLTWPIISVIIM